MNFNPSFQAQKQQVLTLFSKAISVARQHNREAIGKGLQEAQAYLEQEQMVLVVCGEFKQGKSNLINALLNEPNLFPVDRHITTSLVSTISYGETEKITVYFDNGQSKQIPRAEISKYVTEQKNKDNQKEVSLLTIETPNPLLKQGLLIADTPGVGGLYKNHAEISYAYILNADAVLFVSDAQVTLSDLELQFVKKIESRCQNFLFAVTKIDREENYQLTVENNRKKLAQVLERSEDSLTIIPVSSYLKEVYLESQAPEDLEDSNFSILEKELWQFLNQQRGYILILRALSKLGQYVSDIKQPIQAEWEAYQKNTQEELAQMEQQFEADRQRYQELLNGNAQWLTLLKAGMDDIEKKLKNQFAKGEGNILHIARQLLDDDGALENPEQIGKSIVIEINILVSDLSQEILHQAEDLQTEIEIVSGLNLQQVAMEEPSLDIDAPDLRQVVEKGKTSAWKKTMEVGRKSAFTSTGMGFLGGVLGGILGGAAGLAVEVFAGGLAGGSAFLQITGVGASIGAGLLSSVSLPSNLKTAVDETKEIEHKNIKQEVSAVLKNCIEDNLRNCRAELDNGLTKLARSIRHDLQDRIYQEKETAERSLKSIKEARKLSQEQAAEKAATLKAPLQQLSQLLGSIEQTAKNVIKHKESAGSEPEILDSDSQSQESGEELTENYGDFADE